MCQLIDPFNDDLKRKRLHLINQKVLFHKNIVRVHSCIVAMAQFNELGYESLPDPPFSPDLAPSDFLIPKTNKWFGGTKFDSNDEIIAPTSACFANLKKPYYLEGHKILEKCWTICMHAA